MTKRKKRITLAAVPRQALPDDPATPTAERLVHAGYRVAMSLRGRRVEVIVARGERPLGDDGVLRLADAPLDRLARRNRLDETRPDRNTSLHEAGLRLRQHHYLGGLDAIASNDPGRVSGTADRTPITERQQMHRDELRRARSALHPRDWETTFAICCLETNLEQAGRAAGFGNENGAASVALDRLRNGLAALARLWGQIPPASGSDHGRPGAPTEC